MSKRIFYSSFIIIFCLILSVSQECIANDINLDEKLSPVEIPLSESSVRLTRGTYTYTLTKEESLNNRRYVVYGVDKVIPASENKISPIDAYCGHLEIIPADDKVAVRAMNVKNSVTEIKTEADMSKAQEMIDDLSHLNAVKLTVTVLPENALIRYFQVNLRAKDIISVSGIHFKHSDVINNGQKETLPEYLKNTDVFYLTKIEGVDNVVPVPIYKTKNKIPSRIKAMPSPTVSSIPEQKNSTSGPDFLNEDVVVGGILFNATGKSSAIVNGRVVFEGDKIGNIKIDKINQESIDVVMGSQKKNIKVR